MSALMPFNEFLVRVGADGAKLATIARSRLRREFIAVRNSSKFTDWTDGNDTAFVMIDEMAKQIVLDAGFDLQVVAPPALSQVDTELFRAEAARRGFNLIEAQRSPGNASQPAPRPQEVEPRDFDTGVNDERSKTRPKVDTEALARAMSGSDKLR